MLRAKTIPYQSFGQTRQHKINQYRLEKQRHFNEVSALLQATPDMTVLAKGNGLSYGDVGIHSTLVCQQRLNRFIDWQPSTGSITLEPGVTFAAMANLLEGWNVPVIPGTAHASIGGGIANDIHGKNQSKAGCIGHHINWMELFTGKEALRISPSQNADLFAATIGGLGLTGIIKKINITLSKKSSHVYIEKNSFTNIGHGLRRLQADSQHFDYTAAWFDPYQQGRGIIFNANHIEHSSPPEKKIQLSMPFTPPFSLINASSCKLFNKIYFRYMLSKPMRETATLLQYNNPLDGFNHWNRFYGSKGLYQFQCVVPFEAAHDFVTNAFLLLKKHQASPSLSVMKVLGQKGLGLLSFAMPGITFAIDFPATNKNKKCIEALNTLTLAHQGKVYLAKDALLTANQFKSMYPEHKQFQAILEKHQLNQHFSSLLGQRLIYP